MLVDAARPLLASREVILGSGIRWRAGDVCAE
jgi:hypothetical protein